MLAGRLTLPFALRSGKLATPWERMQLEYSTPCGEGLDAAVLLDLLEDPQPAVATTPMTTTSAIDGPWRWRRGALLVLALYMLSELLPADGSCSCTGRPVTPA
jgi:hypothetical protein